MVNGIEMTPKIPYMHMCIYWTEVICGHLDLFAPFQKVKSLLQNLTP